MKQKPQQPVSPEEPTDVRVYQDRVYVIEKNGVLEVSDKHPEGVSFKAV